MANPKGEADPGVKQKIIAQARALAEAGKYDRFPEFKELCLSQEGYDPEVARLTLAHHVGDKTAITLLMACNEHSAIWHSKLKASEPDSAGAEGSTVYIVVPPEMTSGPHLVNCARHIGEVIAKGSQGPFRLADRLAAALHGPGDDEGEDEDDGPLVA